MYRNRTDTERKKNNTNKWKGKEKEGSESFMKNMHPGTSKLNLTTMGGLPCPDTLLLEPIMPFLW